MCIANVNFLNEQLLMCNFRYARKFYTEVGNKVSQGPRRVSATGAPPRGASTMQPPLFMIAPRRLSVGCAEQQRHAGERYNNGDLTYMQVCTWVCKAEVCRA